MKPLFGREGLVQLRRLAGTRVLLAFDYDGTLAPIVAAPEAARMRPTTHALLSRLAKLYPCVIISGRSRSDLLDRLTGVGVALVIGNHGVESWRPARPARPTIRRWRRLLEARLEPQSGITIEDKGYSIAIHYRRARAKARVRAKIREAIGRFRNARLVMGKQVVNLLPRGSPDKGTALGTAQSHLGCRTAIYVGDDDTDEDVFAIRRPRRILTIHVGARQDSLASYFLRDQKEIDRLLRTLIAFAP